MFIELVDALRCPNVHADSWLVASADRMEARHIVSGSLGCPICAAEFPIRDGVVDFRRAGAATGSPALGDQHQAAFTQTDPLKLAALLDLADATGFSILEGGWGVLAHELAAVVDTPLIAVDPPGDITGSPGISVIRCDGDIPLASGAARSIAMSADGRADSAIRVVRARGRVVALVDVRVPEEVRELARDDALWVGEREATRSPLVTLHVRRA